MGAVGRAPVSIDSERVVSEARSPSVLVPGGTYLGLEVIKMVVPSPPSALTAVAPSTWAWSSFLITTRSGVFTMTR